MAEPAAMIEHGPFQGLQAHGYSVLVADPPWSFATYSNKGHKKTAHAQYTCMNLKDIKALPVADLAAPNCALFMWATQAMIPEALATLEAWGFRYLSLGSWAKQSKTGRTWAFGTGYRLRSASEYYFLGMRGNLKQNSKSIRNLIVAPVREHSRKPDELRANAEKMFDGPYCELFARESAPGWASWGNQRAQFDAEPGQPQDLLPALPSAA